MKISCIMRKHPLLTVCLCSAAFVIGCKNTSNQSSISAEDTRARVQNANASLQEEADGIAQKIVNHTVAYCNGTFYFIGGSARFKGDPLHPPRILAKAEQKYSVKGISYEQLVGYQWYGGVTWQLDGYPDSKVIDPQGYKRNAKWYVRVHPFLTSNDDSVAVEDIQPIRFPCSR